MNQPVLSTDSEERKGTPLFSGCLNYFPLALAAVARVSKRGNDKHNPGEPLHWSRENSADHADCIARHLIDLETTSAAGEYEDAAALAWRALAQLQILEERRLGQPPSRGSRVGTTPTTEPSAAPRMRVVYVAHPLGEEVVQREANRQLAQQYVGAIAAGGCAPIADWITISRAWGDEDRRKEGLEIDVTLVERCDELWLCGPRVSPGMRVEAIRALEKGIVVRDMTELAPDLICGYAQYGGVVGSLKELEAL